MIEGRTEERSRGEAPKEGGRFFTNAAEQVFSSAQGEAEKYGCGEINTSHLLLGLIQDGSITELLETHGICPATIKNAAEALQTQLGGGEAIRSQDIGLSLRAKKVLENAVFISMSESGKNKDVAIDPIHVLTGILIEEESVGVSVLSGLRIYEKLYRISVERSRDLVSKLATVPGTEEPSLSLLKQAVKEFKDELHTPEVVTQYWQTLWKVWGEKAGLSLLIPPCDRTGKEIKQLESEGRKLVYVPDELASWKNRHLLGQIFPEMDCESIEKGNPITNKSDQGGWFDIEASLDSPNTDTRRIDLKKLFRKQGRVGQSVNIFVIGSQEAYLQTGRYFDENTFSRLLESHLDFTGYSILVTMAPGVGGRRQLRSNYYPLGNHDPEVGGRSAGSKKARESVESDNPLPSVATPEKQLEIKRFSQEQREALEKQGFVIYGLRGQSIKTLRDAGRKFWSTWHKELPDFEALGSIHSEVAINPSKLFLPESGNKTLAQQEDMVEEFSQELGEKVQGVKAIIGQASDYVELAFAHSDSTKEPLFRTTDDYYYDCARTKTPTSGSHVANVSHVYDAGGFLYVNVNRSLASLGIGYVYAAPLVVPV